MLKIFVSMLFIISSLYSIFVNAKPKLEDYGSLPTISKMAMSPDGNKIAFRKTDSDNDMLVIYSIAQGKALNFIDVSAVRPQNLYFISDDQLIVRSVERKRIGGFIGQHDISAAFVLDLKNGGIEQLLVPGRKIYKGQSGVGNIIGLSNDRKHVYMPAYLDADRFGVTKVALDKPSRIDVVERGGKDSYDFFMGPDGEVLVEETYNNRTNMHRLLVKDGKKWRTIYEKESPTRYIAVIGLTADYQNLVVRSYTDESDRNSLLTMSLKDGSMNDPGFNRDDADVEDILIDINRIAYGVTYSGLMPSYRLFDEEKNKKVQKIIAQIIDNAVHLVDWSKDMDKIIVRAEGSSFPGQYFLFDGSESPTLIASSRINIGADDVHPVATVTVKARDDFRVPTLLTIPKSKVQAMKNLPAIMMPHGGPESYDQIGFDWMAQALANEGYLVIQPNFRGSSGFGYEHISAGYGEWGGKMQDDLTDVLDFLVRKEMVDKDRVCIVGGSYGGYAALVGGAFTPDLYRCVVSINGVSNLLDMIRDDKRKLGRNSWVVTYFKEFIGGDEKVSNKALKEKSPYYYAEQFKAPVLLIHGENDDRVDYDHSNSMRKILSRAKKKVKLVRLKDESHYLESNETRLQALKEVVNFVNKHLK